MKQSVTLKIAAPLDVDHRPSAQWIELNHVFQIPSFRIIGLPSRETAEAKQRVWAAIQSSGLEFPRRRVTVNLSPASVKKRGTGADLAIAAAVLRVIEPHWGKSLGPTVMLSGELGLNGEVKPVGHETRTLYAAWSETCSTLIVSHQDLPGCHKAMRLINRAKLFADRPAPHLLAVSKLEDLLHSRWTFSDSNPILGDAENPPDSDPPKELLSLSPFLQRITALCSAGSHHLLLLGPKGQGKSHAVHWLEAALSTPAGEIELEAKLISELRGFYPSGRGNRVLRVGVDCRPASLIGGRAESSPQPGVLSLAHGGLLVADEFPEWARDSRETLREPLETGYITVTRKQSSARLPCKFLFVATGNLCPCGGDWIQKGTCSCLPHERERYLHRLSGPLLDRIDVLALVMPSQNPERDSPKTLLQSIHTARQFCIKTWGKPPGQLEAWEIEKILKTELSSLLLAPALEGLSLRSRHKVSRIALTLAALSGRVLPTKVDFFEATQYRPERILEQTLKPGG